MQVQYKYYVIVLKLTAKFHSFNICMWFYECLGTQRQIQWQPHPVEQRVYCRKWWPRTRIWPPQFSQSPSCCEPISAWGGCLLHGFVSTTPWYMHACEGNCWQHACHSVWTTIPLTFESQPNMVKESPTHENGSPWNVLEYDRASNECCM